MIFGNLGITPRDGCVEIQIGAATPARTVLFTAKEIAQLCGLLREAASRSTPLPTPDDDDDILGDLL